MRHTGLRSMHLKLKIKMLTVFTAQLGIESLQDLFNGVNNLGPYEYRTLQMLYLMPAL